MLTLPLQNSLRSRLALVATFAVSCTHQLQENVAQRIGESVPHFERRPQMQTPGPMAVARQKTERNAIHDVVGDDGVLVINLDREPGRYQRVSSSLAAANLFPTRFPATDFMNGSKDDLEKSCPLEADETSRGSSATCHDSEDFRDAPGCTTTVEQAIADSHRRALLAAAERKYDWTLIMEDDVVPVVSERFSESFAQAWQKVPEGKKIVRLGWCYTLEDDLGPLTMETYAEAGSARLVDWMSWKDAEGEEHYHTGGCTTAYLVHRSIIPEMLSLFPCCCGIDCCLELQLFYAPAHSSGPGSGNQLRGQEILINMEIHNSTAQTRKFNTFSQSGMFVQQNWESPSSRPLALRWRKKKYMTRSKIAFLSTTSRSKIHN